MLALTEDAAVMIERLLENPDVPDHAGLRIAAGESLNGDGGARTLQVMLAAEPGDEDLVVEEAGARVFIEQTVAPFLDDKLLDVATDGGPAQFSLQPAP
jgi:Fe-S cluster assembly iron-binding protein IscA